MQLHHLTTPEIETALANKGFKVYFSESAHFFSAILARPNFSQPFTGGWKMEYAISFERAQLDGAFKADGVFFATTPKEYARQFIVKVIWRRAIEAGLLDNCE